jgi:CAAD domains of cyanobacterial aminoacyl-tRNA synthetase
METQSQQEIEQQQYINKLRAEAEALQNSEPAISAKQAVSEVDNQVQRITGQVSDFLAQLPDNVSRFYQEYKLPVLSFAILVVTILLLRIGLAVLGAINGIPLVKPIFELIGMGYTGWFIYRYLLKGSTRQELVANVDSIKNEVIGANR